MVMAFLTLMLAISAEGYSFDQAKHCGTIANCLQSAMETGNNLVAANAKLAEGNAKIAEENLALKKDVGELQSKLKNIEWIDVPLDDTQQFDENCEYRAALITNLAARLYKNGMFYPSQVTSEIITFFIALNTNPWFDFVRIPSGKKDTLTNGLEKVVKLEKRCAR